MKRGIDIINAMMRPLDELHARRRTTAIGQQVAEAKAMFVREWAKRGQRLMWLGDNFAVRCVEPRVSHRYRVWCSTCVNSLSMYALDDRDARRLFAEHGWTHDGVKTVSKQQTSPGGTVKDWLYGLRPWDASSWRCPDCDGASGRKPISHDPTLREYLRRGQRISTLR